MSEKAMTIPEQADALIEQLIRAALSVVWHDADEDGEPYKYARDTISKKFATILKSTALVGVERPKDVARALENAAIFLEVGTRYVPNDAVDEKIKATNERLKTRGLADVMKSVAEDCRAALALPPGRFVAEKSEVKS